MPKPNIRRARYYTGVIYKDFRYCCALIPRKAIADTLHSVLTL